MVILGVNHEIKSPVFCIIARILSDPCQSSVPL